MYDGPCCPRLVRKVSLQLYVFVFVFADRPIRCLAPGDDLDEAGVLLRREDHAQTLIEEFELLECWQNYGIIADVVVCIFSFFSFNHSILSATYYSLLANTLIGLHQGMYYFLYILFERHLIHLKLQPFEDGNDFSKTLTVLSSRSSIWTYSENQEPCRASA